jgi:uncharacterized protein
MKNLWRNIASWILATRIPLLVGVGVLTIFMAYRGSQVKLSYELAKILPKSDERFQLYESFKQRYGEDGNILVVGIETEQLFELKKFQQWYDLNKSIRQLAGIKDVVSVADLRLMVRNDSAKRFDLRPILARRPETQAEVDSVKRTLDRLPVYKGLIFSEDQRAHLMLATFSQQAINDKRRISLVQEIKSLTAQFSQDSQIPVHLSGMPFIRTEFTATVSRELVIFLGLAILVTSLILFFFFRNLKIVFFALVVVLAGVVSSVGIMELFGYNITLLSGLIPPLVVVIGVPNCIFLLNKYQEEYMAHGQQGEALHTTIEQIGKTLFIANFTTFIGFGVFAFTGSGLLIEFGIVAALSVMLTYVISLILIPIIFSYLAPPTDQSMAHFDSKMIRTVLEKIDFWVHNRRSIIYSIVTTLAVISFVGLLKIRSLGYIVDDLPHDNAIYADLKWVEKHFKGVMPFEINIDTRRAGAALTPQLLTKIKRVEKEFARYPEFAQPISLVQATKFVYQAYRGGDPKYFALPPITELNKLREYNSSTQGQQNKFNGFLDSTKRYTRVSFQMADVGTVRTQELINQLQGKIDTIFNYDSEARQWVPPAERYDARITGNAVVYALQNEYLEKNLIESTFGAIFLIAIVLYLLFANWRLIPVAVLPSLIPLLFTAGLMGYFDIYLKPSTILIFSIAFGVSSDGTIYFLTRYKDELKNKKRSIEKAVSNTIAYTGVSMFYTAIILFSGFFIFTASTFKGTMALGILISITLLMGMICNLILLPAMLLTAHSRFLTDEESEKKKMDE